MKQASSLVKKVHMEALKIGTDGVTGPRPRRTHGLLGAAIVAARGIFGAGMPREVRVKERNRR